MKDRAEPFDLASLAHAPTGMPKYLQLRNSLAAAIADGRWQAGARFPTEDRLTEATGLSLGTVQKALKSLADEGLVARRQGTGTFVTKAESPMNAPFYHCRFLGDDGELLPIYSKFVGRHAVTDKGEWSRHFEAREVTCIERIFSIDNEFSIYTNLYFDAQRLPMLAKAPAAKLNGANLKSLITREAHLPLARFTENLAVAVFPPHVCEAIGVKPKTSGAVLEITASDRQGVPVYFQELFVPPTKRRLFIAA